MCLSQQCGCNSVFVFVCVCFRMKSLAERRAEICEDYSPCRLFTLHYGSQMAYQTYFSAQQLKPNPHLRRY
uniref:Osteocalcin-like C-terminal domain-containing protein n=1 Tax=Cyprinus carpio TaxID=7962 RepID=A0A8C1V677_CYPCA